MTLLALVRNDVFFTRNSVEDARMSTLIHDVYLRLMFAVSLYSPRDTR